MSLSIIFALTMLVLLAGAPLYLPYFYNKFHKQH